jgi:CubicO group peptidase (beta-lactamase class C family)
MKNLIIIIVLFSSSNFLVAQEATHTYTKPEQLRDRIKTAFLKDVGIDEHTMNAATDSIIKGVYPNIHSLLIIRDNKLVYENYFPGNDVIFGKGAVAFINHHRDSLHDIRSITKSVVSAAVMIAIGQGRIKNVDQRVFDFFPEYAKYDTGIKKQLTIKHLLAMSSGIEWDESMSYADTANSERRMTSAKDPVEYFLSQRSIHKPNKVFNYSGGCTQTLAAIVAKATGMRIDYFV